MHGILTLHDQIQNGEIIKRRAGPTGGGAAIEVDQRDGVPSAGLSERRARDDGRRRRRSS